MSKIFAYFINSFGYHITKFCFFFSDFLYGFKVRARSTTHLLTVLSDGMVMGF